MQYLNNQLDMTISLTIGVLALQGAFSEHTQLLRRAFIIVNEEEGGVKVNWNYIEVRTPKELDQCDALIVPGGESTTISLVAARSGLLEPLRSFVKYVHQYHPSIFAYSTSIPELNESPHGELALA